MLKKLRDFFSTAETVENDIEKNLRLATAALLIEVARADFQIDEKEQKALAINLETILNISDEEIAGIISEGNDLVAKATSIYEFTNLINENCSKKQKVLLLQSMWQVAYADGNIDRYEEHLIRRVAELTHVTHSNYIKAKLSASAKLPY